MCDVFVCAYTRISICFLPVYICHKNTNVDMYAFVHIFSACIFYIYYMHVIVCVCLFVRCVIITLMGEREVRISKCDCIFVDERERGVILLRMCSVGSISIECSIPLS
jgi:hypothetical protein